MALTIKPMHPTFGAEISGVDVAKPLDPRVQAEVAAAMDRYGVCVYRNTGLTDEGHVAFSRIFGELMLAPRMADRKPRMPLPELFDAGNLDDQGNINDNEMLRLHKRGDRTAAKFAIFHLKGGRVLAVEAVNAPAEFMAGRLLIGNGKVVDRTRLVDPTVSMKEVAL